MPPLTEDKKREINTTLDDVKARVLELQNAELNSISADKLTTPPAKVQVPEPIAPSIPKTTSQIVNNITRNSQGFIEAQTEEARNLKDLQATYGETANLPSLSSLYQSTLTDYGVTPESFKELKDIQLQLSDMNTESDLTKTRVSGAAGQTLGQGQREVTQEDRENAVRSAGLAARSAVLTGNIETARAAASEAVNITYQDRQLTAQNLLNQINMVQGTVDKQTQQLLDQEKRVYEEELADIQEIKDAINAAVGSGYASSSDIATLTSSTVDDETKRRLAYSIVSRANAPKVSESKPTLQNFGTSDAPNWKQYNSQTGTWEDVSGLENVSDDSFEQYRAKSLGIQSDIQRAGELISNSLGISATSGIYQPDAIGGFFTGAFGVNSENAGTLGNLAKFVPVIGNIIGATQTTQEKADFLNGLSYIVNNQTFDKLTNLKEGGATFGALSDSERVAIGRAASDLASSIDTDETGNIIGFRPGTSPEKVVENLNKVLQGYQAQQDQLNIDYGLDKSEYLEGYNTWNQ